MLELSTRVAHREARVRPGLLRQVVRPSPMPRPSLSSSAKPRPAAATPYCQRSSSRQQQRLRQSKELTRHGEVVEGGVQSIPSS